MQKDEQGQTPSRKHDSASPSDQAARDAIKITGFINMIAILASPQAITKANEFPSRQHVIQHIDEYLAIVDDWDGSAGGNTDMRASEPHARKLRALCQHWTPSAEVPADIVQASRDLLAAFGIPQPPGGWGNFESMPPESAPEPEDPDPRAAPTEAELAARPDIVRVGAATMWLYYVASPKMVAKISPADLRRPALGHIDNLLGTFRPIRSNLAKERAMLIALIQQIETMRGFCEAWDGSAAAPLRVQDTARKVLMMLQHKSTSAEYEAFDVTVDPFNLQPP